MTAAEFVARLPGARRAGNGWTARCPAHEDRTASLSIGERDDGGVLFHCFAGCDAESVLRNMGLSWRDVLPDRENGRHAAPLAPVRRIDERAAVAVLAAYTAPAAAGDSSPAPSPIVAENGAERDHDALTPPAIADAVPAAYHAALLADPARLAELRERRGLTRETVSAYEIGFNGSRYTIPIRDEAGVCRNLRCYKPDAGDAAGKMISWRTGYGAARLYPLHLFNAGDDRVVICEGEADALLARQHGFNAVTATGGAGTWRDEWVRHFAGANVVIAYDHDDAGRDGAARVARPLAGVAASLRIHAWDADAPAGYDLTDYLHSDGHPADDFAARLDAAPLYVPVAANPTIATEASGESASDAPDIPLLYTDVANGRRFAAAFGDDVKHTASHGWLRWDGARFRTDDAASVERCAKQVSRLILREAVEEADDARRSKLIAWAAQTEGASRQRALLDMARSEPAIAARADDFDRDPWLFNVTNGTVELPTGTLRPHDRADRLTQLAPVIFDERAECPRWLAFLHRIFDGNAELIAFMRRAIGYTLSGSAREQVLFFAYGHGANGKSTLLEVIRALLGDYATAAPFAMLAPQRGDGPRNDIARLRAARYVSAIESGEGRKLDEVVVKQLTGGDRITARFLYREAFEFTPQFKLWLAANHKPTITGTDTAIWRRVLLVPFTVTIPPAERDGELTAKLIAEAPGILNWALRGCLNWQRDGLQPPASVRAATDEYRAEQDALAGFFAECIERDPRAATPSGILYATYRAWARHAGENTLTERQFSQRLTDAGFDAAKAGHSGVRVRRGLRLSLAGDALHGVADTRTERER